MGRKDSTRRRLTLCAGGSPCGGIASNIVLVQASDVTIAKLRLEGDNPNGPAASSSEARTSMRANGMITDTLENAQAEEASIAMFALGGSGVVSRNELVNANGAISANHSTPVRPPPVSAWFAEMRRPRET